ncbi:MAG TPA: peptidase M28, partial [Thermoanaerobaculia bacterium]|nr:peptidase M28 [Thermoanaerobaculia bacterium]
MLIRSLSRILVATCGGVVVLFLILAVILRQPVIEGLRWNGGPRADARRLESDVRFLTTTALPRSAAHPQNLQRTAAWIARSFQESGGRVTVQAFRARGHTWENVVAEFGPADRSHPLLVIGAH